MGLRQMHMQQLVTVHRIIQALATTSLQAWDLVMSRLVLADALAVTDMQSLGRQHSCKVLLGSKAEGAPDWKGEKSSIHRKHLHSLLRCLLETQQLIVQAGLWHGP